MILTTGKIITLEITKRIADQFHGSITSAKAAPAAEGCSVLVITISNAPNPTDRAVAMSTTNLVSGPALSTDKIGSIAAIAALDSAATVCPSRPLRGVDGHTVWVTEDSECSGRHSDHDGNPNQGVFHQQYQK